MFEHRVNLSKPSDQWHIYLKGCKTDKSPCTAVYERGGREIARFKPSPAQFIKILKRRGVIRITTRQQIPV